MGVAILFAATLTAQKFFPDDPLEREPPPLRVEEAKRRKLSDYYDFFSNTFAKPGERHLPGKPIPAGGVNTLGEVLDGAWYENRHGRSRMTIEELTRGPGSGNPPSEEGPWTVLTVKSEGVTPGFLIEDSRGTRYLLKFDPLTNPEMASAADVIGAKFFHALGYHVPENYIVHFSRDRLLLTPRSVLRDTLGKRRTVSARDLDEILLRVPRAEAASYRAVASLFISGQELGPFRYYGTRRDDPNDIVPHEHRRDLRGLFVFAAWLGHDDSRAINTDDFLVEENGLRYIKHYLLDFGSILGSASEKANSARSGNEHLFAWRPALVQLFTLGLYVPRWARADYPDLPSVGRFEYKIFEPEKYKTEYPNPAFRNRLPDDTFWGARQVMRFTDEEIRAIVRTGRYSDPVAEDWVMMCLIERRDKIGRTYFVNVLPLDGFEVRNHRLEFVDLAVSHGFTGQRAYDITWSSFDNQSGRHEPIGGRGPSLPREALSANNEQYFAAAIHSGDPAQIVTVYLRNRDGRFQVVGIERGW